MNYIFIIDPGTGKTLHTYYSTRAQPEKYPEYGDARHVVLPSQMHPMYVRIEMQEGDVVFYEDLQKKREYERSRLNEFIATVRSRRNMLLADTDWIVSVPDAPLTDQQKKAWIEYRKQLRNLPSTILAVGQVVWPTPPTNI